MVHLAEIEYKKTKNGIIPKLTVKEVSETSQEYLEFMEARSKVERKPIQITKLYDVITNAAVHILLPEHLMEECYTFLDYKKIGKYDQEAEQMLIDKVNDFLREKGVTLWDLLTY